MINLNGTMQVASLPEDIEWQGTCVVIRIPIDPDRTFNLYDYIS